MRAPRPGPSHPQSPRLPEARQWPCPGSRRACCPTALPAPRPSRVPKSVAIALISSFGPEVLASSSAHPLDRLSFSSPHKPLGSAAVIASPAIMGLSSSLVHSSGVKFVLLTTADLLYGCARWLLKRSRSLR